MIVRFKNKLPKTNNWLCQCKIKWNQCLLEEIQKKCAFSLKLHYKNNVYVPESIILERMLNLEPLEF